MRMGMGWGWGQGSGQDRDKDSPATLPELRNGDGMETGTILPYR